VAKFGSLTYAFDVYHTKSRDIRKCWSARNDERKTVVGAMLKSRAEGVSPNRVWRGTNVGVELDDGFGFRMWRDDMNWAWNNCDRIIRLIEVDVLSPDRRWFVAKHETVIRLVHLKQGSDEGEYEAREERTLPGLL
jgi:hypothetical protein